MSSPILHSCPFCGHVTDISEILTEFVGNPHCTQCGLTASEGNLKAQDDLISLFNTHMNMSPHPAFEKERHHDPITYSITQHYHHSAHVAQRPNPPGTLQEIASSVTDEPASQVFETLRQYNIVPSSLSSNQLELYANAIPEQQSRLIQMWQICPEPGKSAEGLNGQSRTAHALNHEMLGSGELNEVGNAHQFAEPYMLSGYDLASHHPEEPTTGSPYRLSNDPIYQGGGQCWWERTQGVAMEY
ncbi:hypothetical protein BJY04DRAFT_211229 [Aspergillus karnatakaensis]|uniref:uncharacterized protein n=1 Tax=Aspergillus karnatakaensis TaxID=1810916 RepID=UPI003CCD8761